jgi:hypothetical protein
MIGGDAGDIVEGSCCAYRYRYCCAVGEIASVVLSATPDRDVTQAQFVRWWWERRRSCDVSDTCNLEEQAHLVTHPEVVLLLRDRTGHSRSRDEMMAHGRNAKPKRKERTSVVRSLVLQEQTLVAVVPM